MADVEMSQSKPRSSESCLTCRQLVLPLCTLRRRAYTATRAKADNPDLRYGQNKGRPTTVIPKTVRPSHKKGIKT